MRMLAVAKSFFIGQVYAMDLISTTLQLLPEGSQSMVKKQLTRDVLRVQKNQRYKEQLNRLHCERTGNLMVGVTKSIIIPNIMDIIRIGATRTDKCEI